MTWCTQEWICEAFFNTFKMKGHAQTNIAPPKIVMFLKPYNEMMKCGKNPNPKL
jgi:hypothetical protein